MNSDDLLFRVTYTALNENPNYPEKQLWQLTKDHLEFLNSIDKLDEITKIKIQIITYELLEKIVTPQLDKYIDGSIDVPMEEIYGDEAPLLKKIYESDFEEQELLDAKKINNLINRILYLPVILTDKIDEKESQLIIKKTENELLKEIQKDKQREEKNKIDSMSKSYIETCEKFLTDKPTNEMLEKISGVSKTIWKHQLSNVRFLSILFLDIISKINQAKTGEKEEFWKGVYSQIEKKMKNAYADSKVKKVKYQDDFSQKRTDELKNELDSDDENLRIEE